MTEPEAKPYSHPIPYWARDERWYSSMGVWMTPWDTTVLTSRYKLLKQLGVGAYGVVALAQDCTTGKSVAIKRARWNHPRRDDSHPTRLLRETALLLELRGLPNLLQVENILVSKSPTFKEIYVVTQAADADMTMLFTNKVLIVTHHLRWWGYKLSLALALIHAKGIVHRDIKPENVFITENCDLYLGDFGLARVVGAKAIPVATTSSMETQQVCTRWYRPPEALLGKASGTSIDIWSFGCLMAELFLLMQKDAERKPLFPGWYSVHSPTDGGKLGSAAKYDQLSVIQRVLGCPRPGQPQTKDNTWDGKEPATTDAQELERWQKQFPDVPDDLLDVMHRCLQWDPKERITAEELLAHPAFTTVRNMRIETPALEKARATGLALVTESDAAKDDEGRRAALKKLVEQLEP